MHISNTMGHLCPQPVPRWRDVLLVDSRNYPQSPREKRMMVIAQIAEKHGMTIADICGQNRQQNYVNARWEAIAAVRREFPKDSLPQLGRLFNRDHTSIMHALAKMAEADNG